MKNGYRNFGTKEVVMRNGWRKLNPIARIWKCLRFLPYIWQDEDYNFESFLPILKYKLERLEARMNKDLDKTSNLLAHYAVERNQVSNAIAYVNNIYNYPERYAEIDYDECPLQFRRVKDKGHRDILINEDTGKPVTEEEWSKRTEWVRRCRLFKQDQIVKFYELLRDKSDEWWSAL